MYFRDVFLTLVFKEHFMTFEEYIKETFWQLLKGKDLPRRWSVIEVRNAALWCALSC